MYQHVSGGPKSISHTVIHVPKGTTNTISIMQHLPSYSFFEFLLLVIKSYFFASLYQLFWYLSDGYNQLGRDNVGPFKLGALS